LKLTEEYDFDHLFSPLKLYFPRRSLFSIVNYLKTVDFLVHFRQEKNVSVNESVFSILMVLKLLCECKYYRNKT